MQLASSGTAMKRLSKPLPPYTLNLSVDDDEDTGRRKVTAKVLRQLMDKKNKAHSDEVSNEAIQHCVMRISSMSKKALSTRLEVRR